MVVVSERGSSRGKDAIAADVWRMLAGFSLATFQRGRHFEELKQLGLTPGHLKVLGALEPGEGRPMGVIADACNCDPSMATWLVDRLEERGLVARAMLLTDRRVKTVVLTTLGIETKERLFDAMFEPPEELLTLDRQSLESLRRALMKLPRTTGDGWASRARTGPHASVRRP
jgi:DNA-binding MarR family transcriptional regulator